MKTWSEKNTRPDDDGVVTSATNTKSSLRDPPVLVWVSHTPTPDNITDNDDDDGDAHSTGHTPTSSFHAEKENSDKKGNMKGRLKSLIPLSWGRKGTKESDSEASSTGIQILPNGTRVSPPMSPLLDRQNWNGSLGSSSQNSQKPLLRESPSEDLFCLGPGEESLLSSIHPAEYYAEKLEVYKLKYSYLKSWPGLLRLLAGLQLLFGGVVIACVIAYIQKDSEWSNTYGQYNGVYNNGFGPSGYSYSGPMTPFILTIAGISWIITLCLLVMGMTMYYRTILLDSPWWPLTEALINVALFLFYMAAGIVYVNDLNRGGLCHMTIGVNPVMANLCRVDGGQMVGTAFIFINMIMYLGSFLVCLKMWRHEAARREMQNNKNKLLAQAANLGRHGKQRMRAILLYSLGRDGPEVHYQHQQREDKAFIQYVDTLRCLAGTCECGHTEDRLIHSQLEEYTVEPLIQDMRRVGPDIQTVEFQQSIPLSPQKERGILLKDETDQCLDKDSTNLQGSDPVTLSRASHYTPKVHIIADYIMKYPEITCTEKREMYRAVFNDQYQEYKDLHRDISATLDKFRELDAMMGQLPRGKSLENQQRIQRIWKIYQQKKTDPAFLEKKERCDYLKAKLTHIKKRIRAFDQESAANGPTG
ncbi:MARVEL domain-containing protein 2-like [Pholidichthys leucotaenia]